jgi:hypothetical protein
LGRACFVEVPGMGYDFTVNKKFHTELTPLILNWMKEALHAQN